MFVDLDTIRGARRAEVLARWRPNDSDIGINLLRLRLLWTLKLSCTFAM